MSESEEVLETRGVPRWLRIPGGELGRADPWRITIETTWSIRDPMPSALLAIGGCALWRSTADLLWRFGIAAVRRARLTTTLGRASVSYGPRDDALAFNEGGGSRSAA